MDVTTATPVQIDTLLAAHWQKIYRLQHKRDSAWTNVVHYVTAVLRAQGEIGTNRNASTGQISAFLHRYESITTDEERTNEFTYSHVAGTADAAWRQNAAFVDYVGQINEILDNDINPLESEFVRRGGWTRAFLVSNSNGHVHSSRSCNTCYPTTEYHWLTEFSGKTENEVIEAAGARACTVCYPDAPVEVLQRPTTTFTPAEEEARQVRDKRAAEKAVRESNQIVVRPFRESFNTTGEKVFKSVRAVTNHIAADVYSLSLYGADHPDSSEWIDNVNACVATLKERGVEYDLDATLARVAKKARKEGWEPKSW